MSQMDANWRAGFYPGMTYVSGAGYVTDSQAAVLDASGNRLPTVLPSGGSSPLTPVQRSILYPASGTGAVAIAIAGAALVALLLGRRR
jgi:hypothetical protein